MSRLKTLYEVTLDVPHLVAVVRFKCMRIQSAYPQRTGLNESEPNQSQGGLRRIAHVTLYTAAPSIESQRNTTQDTTDRIQTVICTHVGLGTCPLQNAAFACAAAWSSVSLHNVKLCVLYHLCSTPQDDWLHPSHSTHALLSASGSDCTYSKARPLLFSPSSPHTRTLAQNLQCHDCVYHYGTTERTLWNAPPFCSVI